MKVLLFFLVLLLSGCCTISAQSIVVRDGSVSANSFGSVINSTACLAESMRRVEQDQLVAHSVLDKAEVQKLKERILEVRSQWAKTFALLEVARTIHLKLVQELKLPAPRSPYVQAYVDELSGLQKAVYEEIEVARKRITERKISWNPQP